MNDQKNHKIINYYQSSQWLYKFLIYNTKTLGMHFGFWDKNTKNRQEAIANENDEIIKIAGIKKGMKVLDAGCGVGGTTFHIAEKTGAKVWGITITPQQVTLAKKYAQQRGIEQLVNFSVQDYTKTQFSSKYFDVVVGIESICYASPKATFLKEAYRILKPGGKVIIADGYLERNPKNNYEKKVIQDFEWAFALPTFDLEETMRNQIRQSGFIKIQSKNMLKHVKPSIDYYANFGKRTEIVCVVSKYIPNAYMQAIYKNYLALKMMSEGINRDLLSYYIHSGVKLMDN